MGDEDDCGITDTGKVVFISVGTAGADDDATYGALNLRCDLNWNVD